MKKRDIFLVGDGRYCRSCIDVLEDSGEYNIIGVVDRNRDCMKATRFPYLGAGSNIPQIAGQTPLGLITIGQIKDCEPRRRLYSVLANLGATQPTVISLDVATSTHAKIGSGTVVLRFAVVNAGSCVWNNSIVNTHATIEHDAMIGEHCHKSTGARVNGGCVIGNGSFIGSNSTICNGMSLVSNTVIGAGAVVVDDIRFPGVYVGIPARNVSTGNG